MGFELEYEGNERREGVQLIKKKLFSRKCHPPLHLLENGASEGGFSARTGGFYVKVV